MKRILLHILFALLLLPLEGQIGRYPFYRSSVSGDETLDGDPTSLTVTGMRNTEIDFEWTQGSTNQDGYRIYKSTNGIDYTVDGTTTGEDTTYTATGMTAGSLYYFKVVAYKDSIESNSTNVYDTRFKITINTELAGSDDTLFILPNYTSGIYDYYVDWGDGSAEENITTAGNHSHDYDIKGIYQIKIRGTMPHIYFANTGDILKLITVDNWGNIAWESMDAAFYGCANMTGTYIDCPNTTTVTTMASMFRDCTAFNQPVNFNTAEVISMYYMFRGCTAFNQSVANFNTAKVTSMAYMFYGCTAFNQPVTNFNTAEVITMTSMFYGCTAFNQSVANFNTAKVTSMAYMFRNCTAFNQPVTNFNTAEVNTMAYMFYGCTAFKQSLATFNMSLVSDVSSMLFNCNINTTGTTTNYDATLIAWELQDLVNGLNFHAGTSQYSDTGAIAKSAIETDDSWAFTDGGHL